MPEFPRLVRLCPSAPPAASGPPLSSPCRPVDHHGVYRPGGHARPPERTSAISPGDRPVDNLGMTAGIPSQVAETLCTTCGQRWDGLTKALVNPCGETVENFIHLATACRAKLVVRRVARGRTGVPCG
ncbi:hypothetical protein AORI_8053 [Amycolatopsis keratiniphila]|uniref:Uncharacterized protein n=1 Tax=Amycolatopsis keratiniphila TaxID=129921 RepID=R4T4U2_9PSEU|nr:hypothetical protein AORI_8053 [Amycolatopsis keratiniphila]